MCIGSGSDDRWLSRLTEHLQSERYHWHIVARWTAVARHFLGYLGKRGTGVEHVQPSDVAGYLRSERCRYFRRHHHRPASINGWQNSHTGGIHMLLRLVHGSWPPPPRSLTARDQFHVTLTAEYDAWMQDRRGLAANTRSDRSEEARRFLEWLGPRGTAVHLSQVGVADVDAYLLARAASLRR